MKTSSFYCSFLPTHYFWTFLIIWELPIRHRGDLAKLDGRAIRLGLWVSITVRIEVSAGGRSFPPSERKLEALGTVLAPDGLTVLSLNKVDPTDSILQE